MIGNALPSIRGLLEIIIRLFCGRLIEAVRHGLPRRYVPEEADRATLKGRLDIQRQFTALAATPHRLACRYEELSPDIALNQIMRAAVTRLRALAKAPENQRRLYELSFAFADIGEIPSNQLPWNRVVLDRTNSAWATLLGLAKLLLGQRFQTTSSGEGRGYALLFEMNTLFEEYLGRTLRRALTGTDLEVRLQGPQNHALASDDGVRRFATRPDIVVGRGDGSVLVIDTKWKRLKGAIDDPKRGVSQADVYQMMAYSQIYGCPRVMLVYPHHDEIGADEGVLSRHAIRGSADARLSVASVSLSNVAEIEKRLRTLVLREVGMGTSRTVVAAQDAASWGAFEIIERCVAEPVMSPWVSQSRRGMRCYVIDRDRQ
jgi:5-methylcytosine-specific restriction enzyme subunit McrC